jgi:hypothetical protein
VHGVLADSAGGAWTFGGSILTFAFPMILFIVVAVALYVLYTKPEVVPGHRAPAMERPVSYTALPGKPAADRQAPAAPADAASPTRAEMAGRTPAETTDSAETTEATPAETGDAE